MTCGLSLFALSNLLHSPTAFPVVQCPFVVIFVRFKHVNSLTPPTLMPATPRYRTLQPHAAPSLVGNLVASSPESGIILPCITAAAARDGNSAGNSTRPAQPVRPDLLCLPRPLPLALFAPYPPVQLTLLISPLFDVLPFVLLLSCYWGISGSMLTVHLHRCDPARHDTTSAGEWPRGLEVGAPRSLHHDASWLRDAIDRR